MKKTEAETKTTLAKRLRDVEEKLSQRSSELYTIKAKLGRLENEFEIIKAARDALLERVDGIQKTVLAIAAVKYPNYPIRLESDFGWGPSEAPIRRAPPSLNPEGPEAPEEVLLLRYLFRLCNWE